MAIKMIASPGFERGDRIKLDLLGSNAKELTVVRIIRRGRPSSGKIRVSMLLDPEVIAKFKATGAGWQAKMNECLKQAKI